MPYVLEDNYPSKYDYKRNNLVSSFQSKGFNVLEDKSILLKIVDLDFNSTPVTDNFVINISQAVNADLIVYRIGNNLRVFDCHKKTLIVLPGSFDLTNTNFTNVAMRLKGMGY